MLRSTDVARALGAAIPSHAAERSGGPSIDDPSITTATRSGIDLACPALVPTLAPVSIFAASLLALPAAGCSFWLDSDGLGGADAAPRPSVADDGGSDGMPTPDAAEPDAAEPDGPSPPVDVAGEYIMSVTNEADECGFDGWQDGAVVVGVPLSVTQDQERVTATIDGATGIFVELVLGSRVFHGEVAGAEVELTLFGTAEFRSGNCRYTVNGVVAGALDGDAIEGTIEYRPSTNRAPSCGVLEECASRQRFNGTRPPST